MGLAAVRHRADLAQRIVDERQSTGPYRCMLDLTGRIQLSAPRSSPLATAALWAVSASLVGRACGRPAPPQPEVRTASRGGLVITVPALPGMRRWNWPPPMSGLQGRHRTAIRRSSCAMISSRSGVLPADRLASVPDGTRVLVAGAVTHRQRPATARGVTFVNIEDETGMVNVLCTPGVGRGTGGGPGRRHC